MEFTTIIYVNDLVTRFYTCEREEQSVFELPFWIWDAFAHDPRSRRVLKLIEKLSEE